MRIIPRPDTGSATYFDWYIIHKNNKYNIIIYCNRMTGYAVVSSVRLLRIDSRPTSRLTESPFVTLFIGPDNSLSLRLSIVLRTRTITFKGDHSSSWIISYGSWGIRLHGGIVPHAQIDPVWYENLSGVVSCPENI